MRSIGRRVSRPREIKLLLNGPESFTLDGNFILGEAPELAGYFVCAGFNSAGIANAGRRRQTHRRMDRQRRRAARPVGCRHPPLRAVSRQPEAPRGPHRRIARPPLRDALAARGAHDRPAAAPLAALRPPRGEGRGVRHQDELGARELLPACRARHRPDTRSAHRAGSRGCSRNSAPAARTSWCSIRPRSPSSSLKGRDALAVLQRLCANEIDVPVGKMVYTAMLNARGGFESDLTIVRTRARRVLRHHRVGTGDARFRLDRARHRSRRARGIVRRHQCVLGALAHGPEGGSPARPDLAR